MYIIKFKKKHIIKPNNISTDNTNNILIIPYNFVFGYLYQIPFPQHIT